MRYLSARQVALMLSDGDRVVSARTIGDYTRRGVKVRGVKERIRLRSVRLPYGRAWNEQDVREFVEALTEATAPKTRRAAATGKAARLRLRIDGERPSLDRVGSHAAADAARAHGGGGVIAALAT